MATETHTTDTKQQIIEVFHQLLEERKKLPSRVATKEEVAEKDKDKQIVEAASTYTAESIVKGLADLQLYFGGDIDELEAKLVTEIRKLDEVRRAIEVERKYSEELSQIRIAAEALNILEQEHREKARVFEEEVNRQGEALDREIAEKRQGWQKEQEEHEKSVKVHQESVQKEHQQEEENYQYEVERTRKIETDAYEEKKRQLEAELAETTAEKEKDWAEREKILTEHQQLLEEYKAKAQTFPQELETAVKQAREEAIKAAQKTATVKADLLEKEVEANRNVYELKIQTVNETINKQSEQIKALSMDLKSALKQVQELASRTIAATSGTGKAALRSPQKEDAS